jgi:Na+/glutamate symporter
MELIRDLLIFIAVMFAMCIVLIVVVSNLPDHNPLKRILTALSYRIGATMLAGAAAVPIEPIPGLDVLYDLAVPIALIWFWLTFFRDAVTPIFWCALFSPFVGGQKARALGPGSCGRAPVPNNRLR